jgi:hypothetical protein
MFYLATQPFAPFGNRRRGEYAAQPKKKLLPTGLLRKAGKSILELEVLTKPTYYFKDNGVALGSVSRT